jgi:CRP/FNR family transcriptional regulator, anaerobic regulatory protein
MFDSGPGSITAGNPYAFAAPAAAQDHVEPSHHANWASAKFADLLALRGIPMAADRRLLDLTFPVRKMKAGETLHRAGDKFNALYIVRSGFFKTVSVDAAGAELVLGFPMRGDVVGLDGVDLGHHTADVVALDVGNVAVIPFANLSQLAREHPCVERLMYSLFSRELAHNQAMAWLLGTLGAEARIASFLLDLSDRFGRLGYSRSSFALRATREEIGSYLGLKLETVSRTLSAFDAAGLIEVNRRELTLCDIQGLRRIVNPPARSHAEQKKTDRCVRSVLARAARALPSRAHFAMAA